MNASKPRNIVLLSDGTGNSSAKLMKTNVWRMYEAIDLTHGDQLAMYDNGVGTSSFKPFAVLGGGLGWGLKRNVRNLYMFACANYRPGDRIFAFGFSRGAFTIRVLIGLIEDQGLITGVKGRELERRAKWAYRAYRKTFNPTKGLVTPLRVVRDGILRAVQRGPEYTADGNVRPRVAFVGLWDTVDAYGLPIDEMTSGWDQWVWPLSMSNPKPPPVAEKICHAVALDDERHTFHPVLLDESDAAAVTHTDQERVTQVWFAGVHSNVGGGYPDDSLAHVSLRWMAAEACKQQLVLHKHMLDQWEARADPNGPLFDSRRGVGAYYRYNPRAVMRLANDRFAKVRIPLPKIHESVFKRIQVARDGYAPIVLPERYAVVEQGGAVHGPATNPYEHATQAASRCADQERVWNLVWWRRIAYFTTVALTVLLLVRPFVFDPAAGGLLAVPANGLSAAIGLLSTFLPDMAEPWVTFYQHHPIQLILLGGLIAVLFATSTWLQRSIADRMRGLWDQTTTRPASPVGPPNPPMDWVYRLRSHRLYQRGFEAMTQHVLPFVFGFLCLGAVVLAVTGTLNRAGFAALSSSGSVCIDAKARDWDGSPVDVSLPSRELCQSTGLVLREGERYRVEVMLPNDRSWKDKTIDVETPKGFSSGKSPVFVAALPFRRVLTAPWFVPMVRVGNQLAEYHQIDQTEDVAPSRPESRDEAGARRRRAFVEFTPAFTGQLFLFVNDAVLPGPWLKTLYGNNGGTATVRVTAVDRETMPSAPRALP